MKAILTSSNVLWDHRAAAPYPGIVEAVEAIRAKGSLVAMVSMHQEPPWLKAAFKDSVQFIRCDGRKRKSGEIIFNLLEANRDAGLKHSQFVIVGGCDEDLYMAANSATLLVRAEWIPNLEPKMASYGIPLNQPSKLPHLLELLDDDAPWYFTHQSEKFHVYALTDAGTMTQQDAGVILLSVKLKDCLKSGITKNLDEFVVHLLSSIYTTEIFRTVKLWGWYPSSASDSAETEIMSEFCLLARTTFKCRTSGPLFVRHKTASRRHLAGGDRTDPTEQLLTVHLNPAYRGKIDGSTVVVFDDYLTYGVSFSVARAFLRAAGADNVIGIAMGKFGQRAQVYDIRVNPDAIYRPLSKSDFQYRGSQQMTGTIRPEAQQSFKKKFASLL